MTKGDNALKRLTLAMAIALLCGAATLALAQQEPTAQPATGTQSPTAVPGASAPATTPSTTTPSQQPQSATGFLTGLLPIILIFVVFYFLLIMPQQRQRKKHAEMLAALKAGDKVIVLGGVHGVITRLREGTILVKIAEANEIEVDRTAVSHKQGGDRK
jgi:preprotein translocase subunit YajC